MQRKHIGLPATINIMAMFDVAGEKRIDSSFWTKKKWNELKRMFALRWKYSNELKRRILCFIWLWFVSGLGLDRLDFRRKCLFHVYRDWVMSFQLKIKKTNIFFIDNNTHTRTKYVSRTPFIFPILFDFTLILDCNLNQENKICLCFQLNAYRSVVIPSILSPFFVICFFFLPWGNAPDRIALFICIALMNNWSFENTFSNIFRYFLLRLKAI